MGIRVAVSRPTSTTMESTTVYDMHEYADGVQANVVKGRLTVVDNSGAAIAIFNNWSYAERYVKEAQC